MNSDLATLRTDFNAAQAQMVERLIAWSQINSGTGNLRGLERMARAIESLFNNISEVSERVQPASIYEIDDKGADGEIACGKILHFAARPELPRRILLVGHMDTVFPETSPFQSCEWLDDKRLRGPGVADMKGGIIAMYAALAAFEVSPRSRDVGWDVVINADEETGSRGSTPYLAEMARKAEVGLVYEPALADGTLAGERKGTGNFSLVVHGRSAHAGREFEKGRNAIAMLAGTMVKLHQINAENPNVTLNLGRISGGDALNRVPDLALVKFNVRTQQSSDQTWLRQRFAQLIEEINQQDGYVAQLHGDFTRPPKVTDARQQQFMDLVSAAGHKIDVPVSYKPTGGCCDGNNLKAAGLVNVDTMGVRGANIHSDQEFVLVDSLPERALLSYQVLQDWASSANFLRPNAER